ncbi:unnamed protein product [Caenorhabditis angaria]|uniref:Uncharacterized protein n=1 Tax=Caenorhabditis angaria TaxID=860376 RepID=A0A9P1J0U2_9PELO|nr:unnamed protein product [Caenorhabditis angaria]
MWSLWEIGQFAFVSYAVVRVLKCLFIFLKSFIIHFLTPELNIEEYKNSWTVITGGTDGIGRAYLEELAKTRGLRKFYLIGRNETKLQKTAGELEKTYNAEVKYHVFDFESSDYSKLPLHLANENVGILINCAGIAPSQIGTLTELPEGLASKILRVNLMSSVRMVELILPGMVKRDKGIIVNVSSMTGWRPLPYISSYPASKAALSFFSDSLSDEYRGSNVKIQCLIPMLVATKVASYKTEEANNIFVVTPENFAKQAVRIIGRWEITTGCVQHDVQIALGTLLSFWGFKVLFVPIVMLGVHKHRVASYQANSKNE